MLYEYLIACSFHQRQPQGFFQPIQLVDHFPNSIHRRCSPVSVSCSFVYQNIHEIIEAKMFSRFLALTSLDGADENTVKVQTPVEKLRIRCSAELEFEQLIGVLGEFM